MAIMIFPKLGAFLLSSKFYRAVVSSIFGFIKKKEFSLTDFFSLFPFL